MVEAKQLHRSGTPEKGMLCNYVKSIQERGDAARALSGNNNLTTKQAGFDMEPNAEKYRIVQKGDPEHAAAVVGDTVGDHSRIPPVLPSTFSSSSPLSLPSSSVPSLPSTEVS